MATMATSGISSALGVPTADDTMEISSDAGRGDQDIDLDFMADDDGHDVDWMLQDAVPERDAAQLSEQHTRNDDVMYDDGDEITYVEEDTMEDDIPTHAAAQAENTDLDLDFDPVPAAEETIYDATQHGELQADSTYQEPEETLIDYDAFEDQGEQALQHTEDAQPAIVVSATEDQRTDEQATSTTHPDTVEYPDGRQSTAPPTLGANETPADEPEPAAETDGQAEIQNDLLLVQEQEGYPNSEQYTSAPDQANSYSATAEDVPEASATGTEELGVQLLPQDTKVVPVPETASKLEATTRRTPLHPVTVYYASAVEYSLFPTSEHDDPNSCLLKDPSVASSTLSDFFRACRSVLDQDLNDDQELELYIDSLNLTIPEDSTPCRDTSLAQIVEVYVELMHNAGVDEPPAFQIELSVKERLSAQLTNLFKAASEKKGLYDLPFYQDQDQPQQAAQKSPESSEQEDEQGENDGEQDEEGEAEHQDYESYEEPTHLPPTTNETHQDDQAHQDEDQAEHNADEAEGSIPDITVAVHDPTLQLESQYEDAKAEEGHGNEYDYYQESEDDQGEPDQQEDAQQVVGTDAEPGDGSSSGSSTVHEDAQPTTSKYDPETSFEEVNHEEHVDAQDLDSTGARPETQETYNAASEEQTESFNDSTFDTDTFNQEFEAYNEDDDDVEYHDETTEDGHIHDEADQDWVHHETQHDGDDFPAAGSGTFEVPDESEEGDEDEITFNDDEFTVGDEETQDATTQGPTETSPLGKRSREEDEDGLLDGSDQESKRLRAA